MISPEPVAGTAATSATAGAAANDVATPIATVTKNEKTPLTERPPPVFSGMIWGTGRRKTSVARVRLLPGDGKFLVNEKPFDTYFQNIRERTDVMAALKLTSMVGKVSIFAQVAGGGPVGQAGAISLGISRALKIVDPAMEHSLRDGGFLTRDDRKKERKKYGQRGARRRFQFSKR